MAQIKGVIQKINSRQTSFGTVHSMQIDGEWYSNKTTAIPAKEGQTVEFESTVNAKGYKDVAKGSTVKVVETPVPKAEVAKSTATGSGWLPDKDKQLIISRQASRNAAIEFLKLASTTDSLPLPKAAKNKFEALLALCDQVTEDFLNYSQNGALSGAEPSVGVGDPPPAPATSWED